MDGAAGGPDSPPTAESGRRLLELVQGFRLSQALYVVTALGIPDLLAPGAMAVDDLAEATGAHAPSPYRALLAPSAAGGGDGIGARRSAPTAWGAGRP